MVEYVHGLSPEVAQAIVQTIVNISDAVHSAFNSADVDANMCNEVYDIGDEEDEGEDAAANDDVWESPADLLHTEATAVVAVVPAASTTPISRFRGPRLHRIGDCPIIIPKPKQHIRKSPGQNIDGMDDDEAVKSSQALTQRLGDDRIIPPYVATAATAVAMGNNAASAVAAGNNAAANKDN